MSGIADDVPADAPDDADSVFECAKGPARANFSAIGKDIGNGGTGGGATSSACFTLSFSLSREALLVIIRSNLFFFEGVSGGAKAEAKPSVPGTGGTGLVGRVPLLFSFFVFVRPRFEVAESVI